MEQNRRRKVVSRIQKKQATTEPMFIIAGKFDMPFLMLTLALLGLGLIMLFSASYSNAYYRKDNSYFYIGQQIVFAVLGVVAMLVASFFNYNKLKPWAWLLYLGSLVALAACYLYDPFNGARRWIYFPFNFQPSEVGKLALVVLFAKLMSENPTDMKDFKKGTLRYFMLLGIMAVIVVFQPHLSATILLVAITLSMMFVGGSKLSHIFGVLCTGFAGVAVMVMSLQTIMIEKFQHVLVRMTYWLDPFSTNDAGAYQTRQSLLAIGSGGLMGVGLGDSRQKHLYLPEVQNDFVFSVVCEELGFVGATVIIVLFALLIWRGYTIAIRSRDQFGSLIAVGITTQIGIQVILNIAVVTNTIPNTGISLPMFSYGGTSLMMILGQLGIVLAISRQSKYEKE